MSEEEQSTTVIEKVDIPEVICIGIGCGKPGKMACPTCISKGLPTSPFCSQDCFKSNWDTHKNVHKKQKADNDLPTGFKNYQFSGELRPWQQSPKYKVPDHIQKPDYADHPQGKSLSEDNDKKTNTSIPVYTAEQIAGIREACQIGRFVLDAGGAAVKEGVTCDEIDRVVFEATISKNAYPSPLNYYLFPKSVCTSVNEVICHGIPDKRPLKNGDIVNIDVSVYYNGYHGDLNETFMVGDVDEKSYNLVKCAYDSLANAIASVRPGTLYRELGEKISKVTNNAGFSVVQSYCGHGIGKLFHTAPNVPHYAKNKAKGTMAVGHIFTIEPMINTGLYQDILWPDNWTAVTRDGSRSAQFEHTMLVTENGVELLTGRVGEPIDRLEWTKEKFQR